MELICRHFHDDLLLWAFVCLFVMYSSKAFTGLYLCYVWPANVKSCFLLSSALYTLPCFHCLSKLLLQSMDDFNCNLRLFNFPRFKLLLNIARVFHFDYTVVISWNSSFLDLLLYAHFPRITSCLDRLAFRLLSSFVIHVSSFTMRT